MSSELEPTPKNCFKKVRRSRAQLASASYEGTVALAMVPSESDECDPGCTGEIRETRHIGGIALPMICDKNTCPMELDSKIS